MYKHSKTIPWKQDELAFAIFSDIDISILKHFYKVHTCDKILDIGCGLGYFTDRIRFELDLNDCQILGIDVSETAIGSAREMFPRNDFKALNFFKDDIQEDVGKFDLVIVKDVLWYVIESIDLFLDKVIALKSSYVYISQSFPAEEDFYGKETLCNSKELIRLLEKKMHVLYTSVEVDSRAGRELAHIFCKIV